MDPGHLEALIRCEPTYWWHVAKRDLLLNLVQRYFPPPGRLVEGGVGAGGNLQALAHLGFQVSGLDLMRESVEHCRSNGLDVAVHDLCQPWPFAPSSTRVVVLLDVLEHLSEPVMALKHAKEILEPDGGMIVSIPAGPFLMGPWDRMLGHYRRYTKRMLREQAEAAGFRLEWSSYWNSFSLPPAIAIRTMERWRKESRSAEFPSVSPGLNRVLIAAAAVERSTMRYCSIPFGLSLIGVLRR